MLSPEEQAHQVAVGSVRASAQGRRRLSWWRVGGVIAVLGLASGAIVVTARHVSHDADRTRNDASFAPYVDVTATPQFAFEDPTQTDAATVVLSFIVSAPDDACAPSWGGAYSLSEAADSLDLDRRIARLGQRGGAAIISFGGAANSELAIGCADAGALASAYGDVLERYSVDTIDFDIEGAVASDPQVSARRAEAAAALQERRRDADRPLTVWLTLPVGTTGLTPEGLSVLDAMLAAGVDVAGVNAMTMDYGQDLPSGTTMADLAASSLAGLADQLARSYSAVGTPIDAAAAWRHIGATPMIGQNDTPGERFELSDARSLVALLAEHHAARLSMWSLNRDRSCGPNYANVQIVSDQCSGVDQAAGEFTSVFLQFGAGSAPGPASSASAPDSTAASASPSAANSMLPDDPASSPYEVWNPSKAYPKNTKVVWHHNVYIAKWYSQGDMPDAPVVSAADSPWTLVGPVLPGERPVPTPTLQAGTYPEWDQLAAYTAGDRVLFHGVGFQAKWYSQGDSPADAGIDPSASPWQELAPGE